MNRMSKSTIDIINVTWQEFIETNPLSNLLDRKFIYRGQTNSSLDNEFKEWELVSSFNRYYTTSQDRFDSFISQQISFMDSTYSQYEIVKNNGILNSNIISKIYFLQHYGVPTCFLDFTFNPLIALYFSISGLKGQSGGICTIEGFPEYYPDNFFFTIIKIDYNRLQELLTLRIYNILILIYF